MVFDSRRRVAARGGANRRRRKNLVLGGVAAEPRAGGRTRGSGQRGTGGSRSRDVRTVQRYRQSKKLAHRVGIDFCRYGPAPPRNGASFAVPNMRRIPVRMGCFIQKTLMPRRPRLGPRNIRPGFFAQGPSHLCLLQKRGTLQRPLPRPGFGRFAGGLCVINV